MGTSDSGAKSKWSRALIQLNHIDENCELIIEGVLGGVVGVLALDEFVLYDKSCREVEDEESLFNQSFKCKDGKTISDEKVCNFISDCTDGDDEKVCADCNFENSTCQYQDQSKGRLNWLLTQAQEAESGPSIDNTYKAPLGHYMLVQAASGDNFDYASLRLTKWLKPCSSTCHLEFYYHMFGNRDDLIVRLISLKVSSITILLELNGDKGDNWNQMVIPIGRISSPFSFIFDADRIFDENNYNLAIDDIRLVNCEFPIPRQTCQTGYFTCERKACVAMSRVCDLIDDCGDNSDEINCKNFLQCDFESDMCNWQNENDQNTKLSWDLNKG